MWNETEVWAPLLEDELVLVPADEALVPEEVELALTELVLMPSKVIPGVVSVPLKVILVPLRRWRKSS